MREAVEHALAPGEPRHSEAIVFLIEEKAGFLPVFHVHGIENSVFADLGPRAAAAAEPALALFEALQRADRHVVSLVDAADLLPVGGQDLQQQREQLRLALFDADREGLRHKEIGKAVHRQAREAVGLAEDDAAAREILQAQNALAVVPGVLEAPPPEGRVKAVVGVAGDEAQADLAVPADEACAQVFALFADRVGQRAVFAVRRVRDLRRVDPGVSLLHPARALGRHGKTGIVSFCFHRQSCFLSFQKDPSCAVGAREGSVCDQCVSVSISTQETLSGSSGR